LCQAFVYVGLGPVAARARVLFHEVLNRGAQAAVRGAARCASQVLDRGGKAGSRGTAQVLDRDAQTDACGAAQVLGRVGQADVRADAQVLGRGAQAVARGATRFSSQVVERGAQAVTRAGPPTVPGNSRVPGPARLKLKMMSDDNFVSTELQEKFSNLLISLKGSKLVD
jgi:hypothetical protein